ncbi:MAG: hypothetical protein J5I91_02595 [Bacteroidetes bacterium]|nr:hypothetical protein [Bacteroidota bacterium]
MIIRYEHIDSNVRSYQGIEVDIKECRTHLQGAVKDNLLDREERLDMLEALSTLQQETGFNATHELIADIQALENEQLELQQFRVGEAYAEVILEESFVCRFHWNENRDARNPKGNKTGADLVGFIEVDGQVLFLFGEVKTSSETANRPPQVMTSADGIEKQLRDLYDDRAKRQILITYLQSKARHYAEEHPFKTDYNASLRAYYDNNCQFQLIGVLVRDVDCDERDVSLSYGRLSQHILEPYGIKLLALYLPIQKEEWQTIINETVE